MRHEIGHARAAFIYRLWQTALEIEPGQHAYEQLGVGGDPQYSMRRPGERYDAGTESSTTASARVSHMIRPVNFWGHSNCTTGTGLAEDHRSERCSYPYFSSSHMSSRLRSLAIGSIDLNHPMASLRAVDSFSQAAIKPWERGTI
jgi:hypothetical protein